MGAWIEICPLISYSPSYSVSHPTWVRGLKLLFYNFIRRINQSHPTWVRGLKSVEIEVAEAKEESHPTWVRGLKYIIECFYCVS